MKILVTDGNNRAALAIVRSLGKSGHVVVVGEQSQPSLASCSKYCSKRISYPNPARYPLAFIDNIIKCVKSCKIEVVLPVSDVTTMLICEEKKLFEKYCTIPFSNLQTVSNAANKSQLFQLAEKLDVAIPKTTYVNSQKDIPSILTYISYPIVVKPNRSRIRINDIWHSTSVKYANSEKELINILSHQLPEAYPILLQERISGPGVGIFACYNRGNPIQFFSHKRIREKPPSGGVSVLRESIALCPIARDYAERLLNSLHWHGVAMVEFKVDKRNDQPMLMEINGRFWGSLQLAIDAGVDFPNLLINTIGNSNTNILNDYEIGIKTRWFLGDFDSLLSVLFKSKTCLNLPDSFCGKPKYLLNFLNFYDKKMFYEVLKFEDLLPGIFEIYMWIKHNIIQKGLRRLRIGKKSLTVIKP